ncbi:hypothetical protein [Rubricoccus marinus]|uniref:Uncharacterized protein n=1 Tax=Rubricoccus marinus TaxID=716817 RepID=A0A259TV91_9BACT|nr:hypothetical protein [Rubricoccus marinus]OZC01682.1 hypothetical protein BSZ36_01000 [Rubricoccus marinus]
MTYLIAEIVLCLIAAALLGLLTGWLLWGRSAPADADCSEAEREVERSHAVIQSLEAELATRPAAPEAGDLPLMQREPVLDPIPPPARAATGPDPAPLAPEVFETDEPVSDLDPVPYAFEGEEPDAPLPDDSPLDDAQAGGTPNDDAGAALPDDSGDGPAEATFSDDLPLPAPLPLPPEEERAASPAYDDLKRISGIGPAIESQLAEIGITTYRQIALFTDEDIDRVGAHIDFFADRIRREGWVVQAAALHRQTYGTAP